MKAKFKKNATIDFLWIWLLCKYYYVQKVRVEVPFSYMPSSNDIILKLCYMLVVEFLVSSHNKAIKLYQQLFQNECLATLGEVMAAIGRGCRYLGVHFWSTKQKQTWSLLFKKWHRNKPNQHDSNSCTRLFNIWICLNCKDQNQTGAVKDSYFSSVYLYQHQHHLKN